MSAPKPVEPAPVAALEPKVDQTKLAALAKPGRSPHPRARAAVQDRTRARPRRSEQGQSEAFLLARQAGRPMNKIATIAGLTWKAAFRYRLFWILAALLLAAVVGLPLIIKDDGTAEGMVQILLTYTLTATAGLLGLATLWLSCGTLARDVEECQIQMLVVKPIARWQIWLGKWLGILALDAVLLALAGLSIFCTLKWRAAHLAPDQQKIVNEEIFVSRASAREATPNLEPIIDKIMAKEVKAILSGPERTATCWRNANKSRSASSRCKPVFCSLTGPACGEWTCAR